MIKGDPSNPEASAAGTGADPLIGRTLNGRFSILEPLGVGGMGKVYRALQAQLERVVALKVLNPTFQSSKDPGFQKRFLREASLTSKLRHPNTVTVIDYGKTDDGIYYIAMEYLDGRTLAQVLGQVGPLAWARSVSIAQQICRSLREAHSLGIVHRDLKPANIMLLNEQDQDLVKVLDFGLVKSVAAPQEGQISPEITQNGTFLGSPQYMAPEQARNVTDARSDVYSLGIVLFQMLMGRPPFIARDHIELIFAHYKEAPPTFQQLRPDIAVPAEIEAVVRRCLEKDPARRFQTMDEVLDGLREASMSAGGNSGIFKRPGGATTTGPYPSPALFSNVGNGNESAGDTLAVDISVEVPKDVKRARQRTLLTGGLGGLVVAGLIAGGAVMFLMKNKGEEAPEAGGGAP
ncbi:serine/threonine-protein kinase, partial [Pyxidicoccus sp. 3LG]